METFDGRIERSISWLDLGRKRQWCLGVCTKGVENFSFNVAQGTARSSSRVLYERDGAKMARNVSHRDGTNVGQVDYCAINVEHFIRTCALRMGRSLVGYGSCRRATNHGAAHSVHPKRRTAI